MGGTQAGQAGRLGAWAGTRFEVGRVGQAPHTLSEEVKTMNPTLTMQRTFGIVRTSGQAARLGRRAACQG